MKGVPTPMPEWAHTIREGAVLRRGDQFRVVREISRHFVRGHWRIGVTFSILRCSWTGRPYTCYNILELVRGGWTYAGFHVKVDKAIDLALRSAIHDVSWNEKPWRLTCCDVVGVLR